MKLTAKIELEGAQFASLVNAYETLFGICYEQMPHSLYCAVYNALIRFRSRRDKLNPLNGRVTTTFTFNIEEWYLLITFIEKSTERTIYKLSRYDKITIAEITEILSQCDMSHDREKHLNLTL